MLAWLAALSTTAAPPLYYVTPGVDVATTQAPLYYVTPGVNVGTTQAPLLESNSSNFPVLLALCERTAGCAGFTIGSGGGEPGDLPPHDCRGSRLYTAAAIAAGAQSHKGVDLFTFGSQNAADASALTPKPIEQTFPSGDRVQWVVLERALRITPAPGGATDAVLLAALARYERLTFVGNDGRTDRAASMATGTCTELIVNV
jgi:hypothetical protein